MNYNNGKSYFMLFAWLISLNLFSIPLAAIIEYRFFKSMDGELQLYAFFASICLGAIIPLCTSILSSDYNKTFKLELKINGILVLL
ncbi:MAG: hypothetical protein J6B75_00405 [Ruminococcus sp.]|nr:hypothetical protein [Ruminococcus sp.]